MNKRFICWVHNVAQRSRRQVYDGSSEAAAIKAAAAASEIINEFRLNACVRVVEVTQMSTEKRECHRRDYFAGSVEWVKGEGGTHNVRKQHDICLGLDV